MGQNPISTSIPSSLAYSGPLQAHLNPNSSLGSSSAATNTSPYLPPHLTLPSSAGLTNNSGLADKLKLGFSDKSPITSQGLAKQHITFASTTKVLSSSPIKGPIGSCIETQTFDTKNKAVSSQTSCLVTKLASPVLHTSPNICQSETIRTRWNVHSQTKPDDDDASDIQIIEEEEEVLVDDFDGHCCRTYPFNHSKIQRWQEERKR